ncbi:agarase [Wenyingzhuangia heitensis]|uniref:Agarase n=1 Tax=Wenyingzhuangia heitensis TaxID=1487859 RepID=A0ABX0UCZ8_9FLAO|nr:hypothetical protein [Wenyingzhuangia heitensis]NIJ44942.1 agarase [Wenyingzhuangia heitensis]
MAKNLFSFLFVLGALASSCFAQKTSTAKEININVELNTKHIVNGIDEFDREKYITIHADLSGSDWEGDNLINDVRTEFLEKYDVYLGRESGGLTGALKRAAEDPNRPGYIDVEKLKKQGENARKSYAQKKKNFEHLEYRTKNMLVVNQFHPIWPTDHYKNKLGWSISDEDTKKNPFGSASAEFVSTYMKNYFGGEGEPRPKYLEVINEPLWDLIPIKDRGDEKKERAAIEKLAKFHKTIATKVKAENPDVLVGGLTCAFPYFEMYDFKRWEYRWKNFIDLAGDDMDFWSIHLYDFPCKTLGGGKIHKRWRKGSNMEATLDMLEQYSMMKYGNLKPIIITEYAAQTHQVKFDPWTPYRDWLYIKSANSMMMSFMDHPQSVAMAIPYIMLKCEWGRGKDGNPYRSRLFRQQFEGEGEKGDKWVYSDMAKFYMLWADVKGKRLDITANNVDLQTDAYVNKNKVYVIANNLLPEKNTLNIALNGNKNNPLISIKKKHYHAPVEGKGGVIDEENYTENKQIELGKEATVILEYTYEKPLELTHISEEVKYYAEEYYQPIKGEKKNKFNLKDVVANSNSRATLRVSIARDHGQNLSPIIWVNGTKITVPENYKGLPQTDRNRFYGTLDIPVPANILKKNNKVAVLFQEDGGQVASVTMRVFNKKQQ